MMKKTKFYTSQNKLNTLIIVILFLFQTKYILAQSIRISAKNIILNDILLINNLYDSTLFARSSIDTSNIRINEINEFIFFNGDKIVKVNVSFKNVLFYTASEKFENLVYVFIVSSNKLYRKNKVYRIEGFFQNDIHLWSYNDRSNFTEDQILLGFRKCTTWSSKVKKRVAGEVKKSRITCAEKLSKSNILSVYFLFPSVIIFSDIAKKLWR